MTVIDDIKAARDHLTQRGWNKGGLEGDNGECCLMGALNLACFGTIRPSRVELNPYTFTCPPGKLEEYARSCERRQRAMWELSRHMPPGYDEPAEFNDAGPTVAADVFDLIDKTLANLGA